MMKLNEQVTPVEQDEKLEQVTGGGHLQPIILEELRTGRTFEQKLSKSEDLPE